MFFSPLMSMIGDAVVLTTSIAAVRHFTNFSLLRQVNKINNDKLRTGLLIYLNSGELIFNKGLEVIKNQNSKYKH